MQVAGGDEARTREEKTGGQENLTHQGDAPLAAASKEDDAPSGGNPVRQQDLTYAQTSAEEPCLWRRRGRQRGTTTATSQHARGSIAVTRQPQHADVISQWIVKRRPAPPS